MLPWQATRDDKGEGGQLSEGLFSFKGQKPTPGG